MSVYLITYDLNSPGQKHGKVLDKIKAFDAYAPLSESSYAVFSNSSAQAIYELFEPLIDDNDRLLVIPMHKPYYGFHRGDVIDWMSKHLPTCN